MTYTTIPALTEMLPPNHCPSFQCVKCLVVPLKLAVSAPVLPRGICFHYFTFILISLQSPYTNNLLIYLSIL